MSAAWESGRRQVTRPGRPVYGRGGTSAPRSPRRLPGFNLGRRSWQVLGSILLAWLIIGGLAKLTTLTSVTVEGAHGISLEHIQNITQDGLDHQWFGHSLLLLNAGALAEHIKTAEPAVKNLELHRRLPHTLVVVITERQPSINWQSGGHLYLLDTEGTVIGDSRGQYTKLPTVVDTANLPVKVGDRVAPVAFVTFTMQLASLLPATGVAVSQLQVPESTSELYAQTAKGYVIKFDATRPAGDEVGDLTAVLQTLVAQHKAPAQYIDLRIAHKAYYK